MKKRLIYQIEFFNYWHAGSGLSGSTYADNIVNKTEQNLPFIPGKSLKGLLRDAAENINELQPNLVQQDFIDQVFGKKSDQDKTTTYKDEGVSFFTNATLSENLCQKIIKDKNHLSESLYAVISSTAIDKDGQAQKGSLRQLEITIPLTLYASIEGFPEKYEEQLFYCFGWIKELGQNRNRGLGKCRFSTFKA